MRIRMVTINQIRAFMVSSWSKINNGLEQMDVGAAPLLKDNTGFGEVKTRSYDEGVEVASFSFSLRNRLRAGSIRKKSASLRLNNRELKITGVRFFSSESMGG
jgi:hypothetical protein